MLGALGCIVPEAFGPAGTPNWVEVQTEIFRPEGLNYLDNPAIIHAQNPVITVVVQIILMSQVEAFRSQGGFYENLGLDKLYPARPQPCSLHRAPPPPPLPARRSLRACAEGCPAAPQGEFFDPLGLADDPEAFAELKVKEIKNGRLAMFSMLGFFVQAIVTGEGPIANLNQHLSDPGAYNAFNYATKFTPSA